MPKILFEDKSLLAVDKPGGMSVHNDTHSLEEWFKDRFKVTEVFFVHRLDKETSGVQIIAKDRASAAALSSQFAERQVQKIYYGIVRGTPKTPAGDWCYRISDKAEGRKNPRGKSDDQKEALTLYTVQKANSYFSLLEFDLKTGRQHQIRKHAAIAGHVLVGDDRYGDPKHNAKLFAIYQVNRLFLHCSKMTIAGIAISAELPKEFDILMQGLKTS